MRSKFGLSSNIPIFLDTMENLFDKEFAVWPERYYISIDGVLQYVAFPNHEFGYNRDNFTNALLNSAMIIAQRRIDANKALETTAVAEEAKA